MLLIQATGLKSAYAPKIGHKTPVMLSLTVIFLSAMSAADRQRLLILFMVLRKSPTAGA